MWQKNTGNPYQVSLLLRLHLHLKAEHLLASTHHELHVLYAAGVGHEQLVELSHHDWKRNTAVYSTCPTSYVYKSVVIRSFITWDESVAEN